MAEKKKMSVAEILAAARKADGSAGIAQKTPAPQEQMSTEPPAVSKAAPKSKPAAADGRPSTSDILAAARAGKAAPAEVKPATAKAPVAAVAKKEAPKGIATAAAKPAAAALVAREPKDTGSILAAARKEFKPGPMSKAEAAAKAPSVKPAPAKKEEARRPVPPMPAKPDYAKPKPKPVVDEGRRSVLLGMLLGSFLGVGFTSLATTLGLWTLGTARFMFPNILTEPPSKFKVGFPSSFSPGQVETKFIAQYGVWVVNWEYNGQGQIYALRTVCTHLGCTPNWLEGEQKFKCPCHGSGFYKDGINFEGPAPRPLERYAIRVADDGQLEIDKSKLFQEEMGQWSDPASYVAV
jgi:cytochrome b6-f complex iron-sulfur subunit